ncbi:MAG: STAS domain-containing protein [Pseudonocardia sp.]|nr:STAS domain-containing protein [Pseudonocardia sp.]
MNDHQIPDLEGSGLAPLHLSAREIHDGVLVITVRGELDSATAPQVTEYLRQVTSPSVIALALDLSEVTFLASSGIQMLVTALRDDSGVDGALHLVAPSPAVRRILTLLGMDRVFTSHASSDELLRAVLT